MRHSESGRALGNKQFKCKFSHITNFIAARYIYTQRRANTAVYIAAQPSYIQLIKRRGGIGEYRLNLNSILLGSIRLMNAIVQKMHPRTALNKISIRVIIQNARE